MLLILILFHQANSYKIQLPLSPGLVDMKNLVLEKASNFYSNLLIYDLSDGYNAYLSPTLALLANANLNRPIANYVFNKDFEKLKHIKTINRMDIVMLYNLTKIHVFLDEGKQFLEFNRFGKYVFFLTTFEEEDFGRLRETMRKVWKAQIWNFSYVFAYKRYYEMQFNPFTDEVMDCIKRPRPLDQYKKFNNLFKYALNVSIVPDPPKIQFKGGKFEGNYIRLLELLGSIINATFVIKPGGSMEEGYEDVKNHRAEFSFVGHYHGLKKDVKYGEPFKRDDLVVLVAKAGEIRNLGLIYIFTPSIWILILLIILTFTLSVCLITKRSFSEIFLYVMGSTTGYGSNIPFKTFDRLPNILLISYTFFGLIIACVYSSSMLEALITKKFYPEINTLDELKSSKLTLICTEAFADFIREDFHVRIFPPSEIASSILNARTEFAYVMQRSYARVFEDVTAKTATVFHVVEETLAPGFQSFYFYKSSPYIYKINNVLKKLQETGLFMLGEARERVKVEAARFEALKRYHIRGALAFLLFGEIAAACAFLGEILIFSIIKFKKRG